MPYASGLSVLAACQVGDDFSKFGFDFLHIS